VTGEPIVARLPDVVPLFPLPNTVFFPYTVLPLHIFEPRYRAMVRDARDQDRLIAVALSRGADFHPIGTVGRLRDVEPLADGRFNIRLEGVARVAFTEVPSDKQYRLAKLEPRPEREVAEQSPEAERVKLDLLATLGYLRSELSESGSHPIVLDEKLPLHVAVNVVCAGLPIEPLERQALLEEDDLMVRQRSAAERIQGVLEMVLRHKAVDPEQTGGLLLN
jgi:Lon protease-like protein